MMAALSLLMAVPASLDVAFVPSTTTSAVAAFKRCGRRRRRDGGFIGRRGMVLTVLPGAVVNAVTTTAVTMNGRKGSNRECMMVTRGS